MALPVDRFITPEQTFEGLYRYSGRLEQNRLRDEQLRKEAEAKRFASDKYFANYLDPKDRFTGTKADPIIAEILADAISQAHQLSARGATDNEIFMAITPLVNRANEYQMKAKQIQAQKKQALEVLGKQKGIDPLKFSSEFDDEVFMETDPRTGGKKMKDLSLIDPSKNYADLVLQKREVFTPQGFDEYLSQSKASSTKLTTKLTDSKKGMRSAKIAISAPEYMEPVIENGVFQKRFQPRYEVYTDEGQPVMEPEFDMNGKPVIGSNGKQSMTPIKMVTKPDWDNLLRNPGTGGYIRQEVRKYANQLGVDPQSPQAEHFGRALAWRLMDESTFSKGTYSEESETKQQPIIINNGSGSGSKTVQPIDLTEYDFVEGKGKDITPLMGGVKVTPIGIKGDSFRAEKVYFDPVTKRVTLKEFGKGEETKMSLQSFLQNIKTSNPGTDMKFLEGLSTSIGGGAVPKTENKSKPKKDPLGIL